MNRYYFTCSVTLNSFLKLLVFTALLLGSVKTFADIPFEEKQALISIYESTNGFDWETTWDLEEPVTNWHGVTIQNNSVIKLNLFQNNLSGILPSTIGDLKNLTELNLAFNQLTGELPIQIFDLEHLIILKLEMNRLKGGLPETISKLTNLTEFSIFNNFLTGPIPKAIGSLKQLKILNLSSNNFKGEIPASLGNLENLESLGLFENSLEGSMPSELGQLFKLKELVLANNKLKGAIPKEVGQLALLEVFQIQNNGFDSFEDFNSLKSNTNLVFDFDKNKINTSPKFKDINSINTRMADTKFEDEIEKEN